MKTSNTAWYAMTKKTKVLNSAAGECTQELSESEEFSLCKLKT